MQGFGFLVVAEVIIEASEVIEAISYIKMLWT